MHDIAHEEERWFSLQRERELHARLNDLKERRRLLRTQPITPVTVALASALEDVIDEVAEEYFQQLTYNRKKGWSK